MFKKDQNRIFIFDIYGMTTDKLNIFNGNNKTKSGLIISFIFIALSIAYALYTLIDYFKYSTPSVIYFKQNEQNTNKTIDMKEPFLFELYYFDHMNVVPVNESNINFRSFYSKNMNDDYEMAPINIEKCEYGKNIDTKYKDQLSNLIIDDMYCISDDLTNYPIFYYSEFEISEIIIIITINEDMNYTQSNLYLSIINPNNVVNHIKSNPISDIYFSESYADISKNKYNSISYNFQYIKYESDKGFIFEKTHTYNGKEFSNMDIETSNYYGMTDNETYVGIFIDVNRQDYDYYSRSYERIQLVIIEIYWIVDIILLIGRIISSYFTDKKTSIELVKYLIAKNVNEKSISEEVSININNNNQKNETIFKEKININNNNQQNESIFKEKININNINQQNEIIFKEETNINNNKINYLDNKIKQSDNKSKNLDNNNEIEETINYSLEKNSNADDKRINVLNSLNYYNIIKSYLCFKDDKTKLINCCDDLITEELAIERILRRMNDMEDQINFISNSLNASNTCKNDKFDEINELIDKIDKSNNQ